MFRRDEIEELCKKVGFRIISGKQQDGNFYLILKKL
jgi:hypothetical protein